MENKIRIAARGEPGEFREKKSTKVLETFQFMCRVFNAVRQRIDFKGPNEEILQGSARCGKENRLLRNQAELAAKPAKIEAAQVPIIQQNHSALLLRPLNLILTSSLEKPKRSQIKLNAGMTARFKSPISQG